MLTRSEVMHKAWATRRLKEALVTCDPEAARCPGKSHAWPSNERIDEAIRQAYRQFREFGNRAALTNLANRIGWPKHQVNRRGRQLGLARAKERSWSHAEESIVERWGHLNDHGVQTKLKQEGFHRTLAAVHLKVKRLRIKQNLDGYSAHQLAEAFGEDSHKIARWIKGGVLSAERRGTQRTDAQGGDTWWIRRRDVHDFILRCPEEYDLAKVEKYWFLDLVTDGQLGKAARA